MKRGFLLRAEAKKSAAKRRDGQKSTGASTSASQPASSQHSKGSDVGPLDSGDSPSKENKSAAVPTGYDILTGGLLYTSDLRSNNVLVIRTIPKTAPRGETQSIWIVSPPTVSKVINATGYPARIPKPRPDLYEIKSTPDMGLGVFAKNDIKRGEIIFAERPLLVLPDVPIPLVQDFSHLGLGHGEGQKETTGFENFIEAALAHLSPESQADFKALENSSTADQCGPLLGIMKTNNYELRNLFDGSNMSANYKFVSKTASRINHSCVPNVKFYFLVNSFSVQFFALRDIKAGDQLFCPYTLTDRSFAHRQADLELHGNFTCNCSGCLNATPETDEVRTTFRTRIAYFRESLMNRAKVDETALEEALNFEKDMLKEGLDADDEYLMLVMAISAGYSKLGKGEESRKYKAVMDKFTKFIQDEWRGLSVA